jgi:alkanesulfonate monooxygenase SsuD/methylene tetrahydromethanopterin reductase-like flavin-dependent oxidoreductase (luciferase family)
LRADIPIYLAAMGPKAVAQACEIADGWLPLFWSPERARTVFSAALESTRPGFDVAATAPAILIDDVEAGRDFLKPYYALYIGGMGARGTNFYNDLFARYGYEDEAKEIQDLYLGGNKRDAAAAIPDSFVDEVALVGPKERLAERVDAWRESGATSILVSTQQPEALRALAEIAL